MFGAQILLEEFRKLNAKIDVLFKSSLNVGSNAVPNNILLLQHAGDKIRCEAFHA